MAASDFWNAFKSGASNLATAYDNKVKEKQRETYLKRLALDRKYGTNLAEGMYQGDYNLRKLIKDVSPIGVAMNVGSALEEGDYKKAGLNVGLLGLEALPVGKVLSKVGAPLANRVYNAAVDSDYRSLNDILGKPTSMPARAVGADVRLTPRGLVGQPRDEYLNYYTGTYLPDLIKAETINYPDIKLARHDTTRSIDKPLTMKEIVRPSAFKPNEAHKLLALNAAKQNANIRAGYNPNAGLFVTRLGDDLGSQKATSKTPLIVSYSVDESRDLDNRLYYPYLTEPTFQPMTGSKAWEAFIPPSQIEKIYNPLDDVEAYEKFLKMKRGKK